ncbi:hypothetical protein GE09DRAFT_1251390 [Coniochaeta sp. 2T2.1]|nr:hypothetical protein GE09DRAFT_1251390 [Coniochaeta sp. 2T2.1]
MGQGFSLATPPAGAAGIDVPELGDLVYEKSIGAARFMKSIRARHQDGVVLVKVLVKPYPMSLEIHRQEILRERKALEDIPNALAYERVVETETNGYLVRQFLYNSLYDRLSTRPFLEDIEKKWLAFQLLSALRDCHSRDIYHGDIKTENTLVTSWNWLYLTDFSGSFKPIMLPEDNPADFSYFFDTSGRRTCYLAPERFLPPGEVAGPEAKITWAMDVFSAGCVIAELFLEAPIFNLSQLYKYRKGEYDPNILHLSRIPDKDLREMISHMIQLDPQKRYLAEEYLEFWKEKVFPKYFYTFLHQYMGLITDPSSGQSPISGAGKNLGEADQRIDRVFQEFDTISYFLGYPDDAVTEARQISPRLGLGHFPVRVNLPNRAHYISGGQQPPADDGTLIFLTLIVSSLRNTARAEAKIKACDILLAFAERLTDEAKLDRVLPYLITLLSDKADMVVIAAVRTITQLLALVKVVPPVNSHVFLEYVMPRMQIVLVGTQSNASNPVVRATYASCIGSLANTAGRFLDMAATLRADGSVNTADPDVDPANNVDVGFDGPFDNARNELVDLFEAHTKALIEDSDPHVRRAFLSSVPELCMFFGTAASNDIILTHLNTYLNDRDWMLKCAFFDTIVGIAAFLGSTALEKFILPLMIQALTDEEEYVVQAALHSLAELANLGLLSKPMVCELIIVVARFTMHPNMWIRESAAEFISSGTMYLSPADIKCMVLPLVKQYLKPGIEPDFSELALLDGLKKPLSRSVFDQALLWALKQDRGDFWKPFKKLRDLTFGASAVMSRPSRDSNHQSVARLPKNDEDEQWLSRLRNLGLAPEDEPKLLALKEFIWKLSQIKARESQPTEPSEMNPLDDIIALRNLGIMPQTVLFDDEPLQRPPPTQDQETDTPRTITDALLDASMTIDNPVGRRRRAALNSHRLTLTSRGNVSPMSADDRRPLEDELTVSPTTPKDNSSSRDSSRRASLAQGKADAAINAASTNDAASKALRSQPSVMSLLNGRDGGKSVPETGTTEANAFGEMEGPTAHLTHGRPGFPTRPSYATDTSETAPAKKFKASHTYTGTDPSILKMLDAIYVDNYPHDIAEFGPLVTPITRNRLNNMAGAKPSEDGWKPKGRLVATFSEHVGAINRVIVSPDHVFFITAGDDGCVKVWDTSRLERNIAHRSRATHRHDLGAKALTLCFIENTHCFISCASDGMVHVVKVDTSNVGGTVRYGKLRLLREYQLPDGEFAVWCEHFKQDVNSVLVLATNKSRVLGIDLRTMTLLYVLENPVHHGTPTCFCVDRKRHWLCLGTSHGVLDLWDLRFKMRLKAWGVPGKSSIYRLSIHPIKGRGKWVCVSGGTGQGEVTVWDLERTLCREIYRVGGNKEGPRGYDPWDVDEDKPEGMLGRFATNIEPATAGNADRGVRAMITGTAGTAEEQQQRDVRHAFMITGGSDKKLRFWDMARIENSTVFSGLQVDEGKPTFTASHPTAAMTLNTEKLPRQTSGSSVSSPSSAANGGSAGGGGGGSSSAKTRNRPPRSTVISLQQQQLLRSHMDAVMDVAVIESPYTMTVSVDRSGVVFVFQ